MAAASVSNSEAQLINSTAADLSMPIISPPPSSKCPWGQASPRLELNLSDIMSEQLADSLQQVENSQTEKPSPPSGGEELLDGAFGAEVDVLDVAGSTEGLSDEMIAQMLQLQFNKEYDEYLKRVEQKVNGASKVSISFTKYKASPPQSKTLVEPDSDSDDDSYFYVQPKSWDSFEAHEKAFPAMSGRGYVKVNNTVITKHDVTMSGRRNACKVMEFPPGIQTGDGGTFDMQLSNKVFNKLKVYSKAEEDRRSRLHDKVEKATSDWAIDTKTRLLLYKMINNCVLEKVYGVVCTGKESVILYASGGTLPADSKIQVDIPKECALKVFKTSLNEFKSRDKYIKNDYRFKDRFSKQNPRKTVHLWAEKELHNLARMNKAGLLCPKAVLLKKHILVLEFIGTEMKPAPKLKDVKFPDDDDNFLLTSAYQQTIEAMKNLFDNCNLIHADLSEFNILWHQNKCHLIDVSQAVEPTHENALEFLYRDCVNVCKFFGKRGLENIHTAETLFTHICGLKLSEDTGPAIINQIRDFERNIERLTFGGTDKTYPFEHCWEQMQH